RRATRPRGRVPSCTRSHRDPARASRRARARPSQAAARDERDRGMRARARRRHTRRAARPASAAPRRRVRARCQRARRRFRRRTSRCRAHASRALYLRLPRAARRCYTSGLPLSFWERQPPDMTSVRVRENEPFEAALRRFKRTIEKTGLLTELRAREFYEKPTSERKRKKAAAVKRHYKRLRSQQLPPKLY